MRTSLTIIAALVFTIQILVNISDIFTTPPAGAIDISTIPPEERPDEGTFYIPIDIEFTVLSIVFFAGGLCLSIAVLLPDKKPKSPSLDISEQSQNITALKKKLAIIATIGFGLDLLFNRIIPILIPILSFPLMISHFIFTVRENLWVYTSIMSIPVAGLCLSIAVLLSYKEPKAVPAEMSQ
jgi:hypothetical protein